MVKPCDGNSPIILLMLSILMLWLFRDNLRAYSRVIDVARSASPRKMGSICPYMGANSPPTKLEAISLTVFVVICPSYRLLML